MDKEYMKKFEGKKGKFILSNGFRYVGKIIEVSDSSIKIIDKWDSEVLFRLDAIAVFSEDMNI